MPRCGYLEAVVGITLNKCAISVRRRPSSPRIRCTSITFAGSGPVAAHPRRRAASSPSLSRAIAKPVAASVRIALGVVEQPSGWSVDTTTGVVTFDAAPGAGVAITAGFEFDVPVRFDTDALDETLDLERLGSITPSRC